MNPVPLWKCVVLVDQVRALEIVAPIVVVTEALARTLAASDPAVRTAATVHIGEDSHVSVTLEPLR